MSWIRERILPMLATLVSCRRTPSKIIATPQVPKLRLSEDSCTTLSLFGGGGSCSSPSLSDTSMISTSRSSLSSTSSLLSATWTSGAGPHPWLLSFLFRPHQLNKNGHRGERYVFIMFWFSCMPTWSWFVCVLVYSQTPLPFHLTFSFPFPPSSTQ